MNKQPRSILIVGGGTAGWMTANSLLHAWPDCQITLIESADIGIIGVGEGATPYLKHYFKQLNIRESEWMPECDATYKVGINFEGWSGVDGYESYFHPFFSVLDKPVADMFFHNCGLRRRGFEAHVQPDDFFVAKTLADRSLSPVSDDGAAPDIDYAYHFDSVKLGRFLSKKAQQKGLRHIVDNVDHVAIGGDGAISHVVASQSGNLTADLFVDCTGFSGRLIHQGLKQQYVSYSKQLFNDAAVAIQTPIDQQKILPQTRSVAMQAGWMWHIPLTSRIGNGYVYSGSYLSEDQAEIEIRNKLGLLDNEDVQVRHLKMRVGRLEQHWHENCLAVGLSQGFIEPLEATALMLTQLTVERFISSFETRNTDISGARDHFNHSLNMVFDGIKDYIVAHYQLTRREDTPYWQDNKNSTNIPHTLSAILSAWEAGSDVEKVLHENKQSLVYLRPSWYCILAGMGRFPNTLIETDKAAAASQANDYCGRVASRFFKPFSLN